MVQEGRTVGGINILRLDLFVHRRLGHMYLFSMPLASPRFPIYRPPVTAVQSQAHGRTTPEFVSYFMELVIKHTS